MRKRKRIIIDYFFTIMILLCFFAFVASCFSLFVALLGRIVKSKISEDRSTGDEFEQKYVSLMTDDTKARREFIELYRKKEGVT